MVRVGDYDPEAVAHLGESQPTRLMLGAVGLPQGSPLWLRGTHRIIVGGLPD